MYKVFINQKSIVLTDRRIPDAVSQDEAYLVYDDFEELHYVISLLENTDQLKGAIFYNDDLEVLWADFRSHFKEIDAGGGLVRNDDNQYLLIFRKGKWDLPKGKIDGGESIEDGALREVEEECGLSDVKMVSAIMQTYHTYDEKGMRILKTTHWYDMTSSQEKLVPQAEEDIEKAEWVRLSSQMIDELDTYPNIKLVLNTAIDLP